MLSSVLRLRRMQTVSLCVWVFVCVRVYGCVWVRVCVKRNTKTITCTTGEITELLCTYNPLTLGNAPITSYTLITICSTKALSLGPNPLLVTLKNRRDYGVIMHAWPHHIGKLTRGPQGQPACVCVSYTGCLPSSTRTVTLWHQNCHSLTP
jgi:hypothetical protein